tara:strand:- start:2668 stop:2889 length:222 start_codon:yes stop_codon:yes gene_type:complete
MKRLINKLRGKSSEKNLINAIVLASRTYPNDMQFGRCVRNFLFATTRSGKMSEEDMFEIMEDVIKTTKANTRL